MTTFQFGRTVVKGGEILSPLVYQKPLSLIWPTEPNVLYSIFVVGTKGTQSTLHYAIVNIPRMEVAKGNVLAPYLPPNENSDRYDLYVYRQPLGPIIAKTFTRRTPSPLGSIIVPNRLTLIGTVSFLTQAIQPALTTAPPTFTVLHVVPGAIKGTKVPSGDEYFKDPASLSERDKKYCRCVLHVMGKAVPKCLQDKAWFETIEGKMCYNPYSVCAKSTRHTTRVCGENYNWTGIPDHEIEGYAHINHINVPTPYDRAQMISNILAWKRGEGKV